MLWQSNEVAHWLVENMLEEIAIHAQSKQLPQQIFNQYWSLFKKPLQSEPQDHGYIIDEQPELAIIPYKKLCMEKHKQYPPNPIHLIVPNTDTTSRKTTHVDEQIWGTRLKTEDTYDQADSRLKKTSLYITKPNDQFDFLPKSRKLLPKLQLPTKK